MVNWRSLAAPRTPMISCGYHLEKRCIGGRLQSSSSRLGAFSGLALVVRFPQDLLIGLR
jgi:hypothetical protein